ncbi:reverse transcriptase, RNaseH, partial [Metarhizium majus ARSEF 297]
MSGGASCVGTAGGIITFDPDKTEAMHFSLKTHRNTPAVRHGGTEKYPAKAMRWLGLWLD